MDQPTSLITANDVLGWIGFILSLLLSCLYAIDDNYRRFPCSIYLYSLLSAAIVSFAIPLGSAVNHVNLDLSNGVDITCKVQGAIFNFGIISWPVWILIESIQVFRMLVLKAFDQNPRAIHSVMAVVGFGVPAGIAILIACLDATVPGTLWCMLDNRSWGFVVQECCLLAASAISVGLCIAIIVNLVKLEHKVHDEKKQTKDEEDSTSAEFNVVLAVELRLAVFVFLTLCVHLAFTVLGVLSYSDNNFENEDRWIARSIFFHVWIFLHIILYGVRQEPFGVAKNKILTLYIRYTVKAPHPDPEADPEKGSPKGGAPDPNNLKR